MRKPYLITVFIAFKTDLIALSTGLNDCDIYLTGVLLQTSW